MTMPHRRFGRTELQIPAITYGGGWVGGLLIRHDRDQAETSLNRAYDAGIDWIDTAALYGNGVSETVIGRWLAGRPVEKRPHLSTKFNVDPAAGNLRDQIFRSVLASYERLGVEWTELVYLHNPLVPDGSDLSGDRDLNIGAVLEKGGIADIMDELRREGLCNWIGYTALGDPATVRRAAESGRFDAAQVYYNLLNPTAAGGGGSGWNTTDFDGLLGACSLRDMGVMGIRIFAGGHLASRERHGREIPITDNSENAAEEARAAAAFEVLGDAYGTPAQTALRFGLACDAVSTVVIGIGEHDHLEQAIAAVEMGPLPDEAIEKLQALRDSHPAFCDR